MTTKLSKKIFEGIHIFKDLAKEIYVKTNINVHIHNFKEKHFNKSKAFSFELEIQYTGQLFFATQTVKYL